MTLPRPRGSECSGGGGRCWETPSRQAARGRLRAADSGRQYALSWPALAPSLPPQYQKDAGFRSSPKSRLRPGQMCRPGASSFSVTLCHCLCPEFVHQFTSFCLRPPSIPPFRGPLLQPPRRSSFLCPVFPHSLSPPWQPKLLSRAYPTESLLYKTLYWLPSPLQLRSNSFQQPGRLTGLPCSPLQRRCPHSPPHPHPPSLH